MASWSPNIWLETSSRSDFAVRATGSQSSVPQGEAPNLGVRHAAAGDKVAYLPGLDGLRAVSILLVLASHLDWLAGGAIGVDIFFVISGYLITRILASEFDRTGRVDIKSFYARRVLRIVPAFALLLIA